MSLIANLLADATELYWRTFQAIRPFQWVVNFACRLHSSWGAAAWFNGPRGVLLSIAPMVVGVGLLQYALSTGSGLIAWLVMLAFSFAVLVLSIGKRDADEQLDEYRQALQRGDFEGAFLHIRDLMQGREPENPVAVNRMLVETLLVRNNERLLAILFWFVVLGPVGAVLYRSTAQLKGVVHSGRSFETNFIEAVLRLQALLDWIPARLTAIGYGIIGSFVDAIHQWRTAGPEWRTDMATTNQGILINCGVGSLRLQESGGEQPDTEEMRSSLSATLSLIRRTVIVWITVFAVLTIVGWLS